MNPAEVGPPDGPVFTTSVNTHPNFTPVKTPSKTPKPPKPPEKPLMPYMRYSREIWESVKASHPEQKLSEIGRIIGRMWRELALHEKQRYIDDYDVDKVKYAEAFKIYQNSPAYQQYLIAKEKFHADEKEVKGKAAAKVEPRIVLPTCDTAEAAADELDYFHSRQLAAARFHRNQRLLQEVFNEVCVPDVRHVFTTQRLASLKRQAETLTMHQKKIDTELKQLVEIFETKKRRLEDGSREFYVNLEKVAKPAYTPSAYDSMVEQAERQLLDKYNIHMKNIQQQQNGTVAPTIDVSSTPAPPTESINQQAGQSPVKSATPPAVGNGTDPALKTEPEELKNGEDAKVNKVEAEITKVVNGEENRVVVNGVDHEDKSE